MTIIATPDPDATPPEVSVAVAVAPGSVMSSVRVWRNDHSGAVDLREQPVAGFDSRTVIDRECPPGESVTYGWTVSYSGSLTSMFDELWASTAAWTVLNGTWNVSAGELRNTGTGLNRLLRTVTPAKCRVEISSLAEAVASGTMQITLRQDSDNYSVLSLIAATGVLKFSGIQGGGSVGSVFTTIDPAHPITIDINATSVTLTGTGGSYTHPLNLTLAEIEIMTTSVAANGFQVGEFEVSSYDAPTTVTETSDPITLDSVDAWVVHPASPAKSFRLTRTNRRAAGIRSIGAVVSKSNRNEHRILGSAVSVFSNTGPRAGDEFPIVLWSYSNDERLALKGLFADDIPLLWHVPPAWGIDFDNGWYSADDVAVPRLVDDLYLHQRIRHREHRFTLTASQSPVVNVDDSGAWSLAAIAVEFASIDAAEAPFATLADLLANNRS